MRVYYHCYLVNDWNSIIQEQLELLTQSGLYNACTSITLVAIGDFNNVEKLRTSLQKYSKIIIYPVSKRYQKQGERVTLSLLYNDCMTLEENTPVLYFHTKGITHMTEPTSAWRQLMGYYNIFHWRICLQALKLADTCGALYRIEAHRRQFDGNFWWANSYFIRKLVDPYDLIESRQLDEQWIGSLNAPYTVVNLFANTKNLYDECEDVADFKYKGDADRCPMLFIDPVQKEVKVQEIIFSPHI